MEAIKEQVDIEKQPSKYDDLSSYYQTKFAEFDKEGFLFTWNWAAGLFGPFWYLSKGIWQKGFVLLSIYFFLIITGGIPAVFLLLYCSVVGNYDYYLLKKIGKSWWGKKQDPPIIKIYKKIKERNTPPDIELIRNKIDQIDNLYITQDGEQRKLTADDIFEAISNFVKEHPGCVFNEVKTFIKNTLGVENEAFDLCFNATEKIGTIELRGYRYIYKDKQANPPK